MPAYSASEIKLLVYSATEYINMEKQGYSANAGPRWNPRKFDTGTELSVRGLLAVGYSISVVHYIAK